MPLGKKKERFSRNGETKRRHRSVFSCRDSLRNGLERLIDILFCINNDDVALCWNIGKWGKCFILEAASSMTAQSQVRGRILEVVYYLQSIQAK